MPLPWRRLRVTTPHRFLIAARQIRPLHARPPPILLALQRARLASVGRVQNRGKKTKASVKLDDLPQGVIPLEPLPLENDVKKPLPQVVRQARSNMQRFENCVVLTRVGGFYELYFEHADEFAPLLNIKRAIRLFGPRDNPVEVPMVLISARCRLFNHAHFLVRPDFPFSSWIDISKSWSKTSTDTLLLRKNFRTTRRGCLDN